MVVFEPDHVLTKLQEEALSPSIRVGSSDLEKRNAMDLLVIFPADLRIYIWPWTTKFGKVTHVGMGYF